MTTVARAGPSGRTNGEPRPRSADASHVRPDQRYAWRGPSLFITTLKGTVEPADQLTGFYFREARHLSLLRLLINGESPWICADAAVDPDEVSFVYVYPELRSFGGGGTDVADDTTWTDEHGVQQRAVDLRLHCRVGVAGLECVLTLTNRSLGPAPVRLAWLVDADFADIMESFSGDRLQHAEVGCDARPGALRYWYRHEQLPLATDIQAVGPTPWRATPGRLEADVVLEPQRPLRVTLKVTPWNGGSPALSRADAAARLAHVAAWRAGLTRLKAPGGNAALDTVTRALADVGSLALLTGCDDEWLALQAGIPLYPALFGRDTITAGWAVPMFDQGAVLDAALTRLGRLQSNRTHDWTDEEPGRIPYQVRSGPLATLGKNPYSAYYADFASPLLFVIGLGHLFAWRGDKAVLRRHWDTARRVLDWARERGDRDQDGYLEYLTRSPAGTKNQGWKDSGNAILYDDGRPVPAPCGTCDLQGYWFAAQQLMAVMSGFMGEWDNARALWRSAMDLRRRFSTEWWVEREQCYALALDADKKLAGSVTSNVGQCLATGIIDDEHLPRVVGRLFAPDMFSGWGIRTLSSRHPAYNPLGYHLGTVWPVENATIVFGLRRFGFDQRAVELTEACFALASLYEGGRIPECVGGYSRAEFPQPGAYPRANPVQTWNQSGYGLLLQSLLGLQPVAPAHTLVVDPVLPPWLPEVLLEDIRLGGSRATLRFARDGAGRAHAEVLRRHGPFHLVHQPPVESLHTSARDRFAALATTILHH